MLVTGNPSEELLTKVPQRSAASAIAKRGLDIVVAAFGLVLSSPLVLAVAVAIKVQDGGPILHRRRCVGVGAKEFDAYKFRSMRVDADRVLQRDCELRKQFEENFKLHNDPRITRLGRFIRKTSIDEIPQFWNVLKGQMSVVGPRMITRPEIGKYGELAHVLLSVKPGVTGYWQIAGRQKKSYEERVRMDIYYIENWSLWWDLRILLQTPFKVIKGEGAY